MTKSLLASRRTKLKLLLISRENPSVENLNAYKQFRNLYNQLIRASKRMYYSEKIDSSKHDPKSLWKTINRKHQYYLSPFLKIITILTLSLVFCLIFIGIHCIVLQLLMSLLIVFGIHLIQFLNYIFLSVFQEL